MAVYSVNFYPKEVAAIEGGLRRQVIRMKRRDSAVPERGDTVQLWTGLRTAGARLIRSETVERGFRVRMDFTENIVIVDGHELSRDEKTALAKGEGFENWLDMRDAFAEKAGSAHALFEGYGIRW